MYRIPILFIIFRRKDTALKSFERIKQVKPAKLYIACDGARENVKGEAELVKETQESILQQIDWECEVKTLFRTKNLGCCMGVYTAINWLFENEEKGIIIEDDCVLQQSFFPQQSFLLQKQARFLFSQFIKFLLFIHDSVLQLNETFQHYPHQLLEIAQPHF